MIAIKKLHNILKQYLMWGHNGKPTKHKNSKCGKEMGVTHFYMHHFQTKWKCSMVLHVTWSREMSHLSKCQFLFSYTIFWFWCNPHYNWISGYRVMKDLTMLNTLWNKGVWTLFLPISQNNMPTSDTFLLIMSHIFYTSSY